MSRLTLAIAALSLVFFSCKKENSALSGDQLKMIRIKEGDSLFYRSFQYDAQNRLLAIIDSNNNGYRSHLSITYDANGIVSKITGSGIAYTFELNSQGKISKKYLSSSAQPTAFVQNTYSYDVNGRLANDSIYSYWTNNVSSIVAYSYDQNDNVIESKIIDKNSGTILSQEQCTYDNHSNPLSGQSIMTYLLASGYELPSGKNNLLEETSQDGTVVNYTYEYNSNGLPRKCFFQDNSDPLVTYIDFFYE